MFLPKMTLYAVEHVRTSINMTAMSPASPTAGAVMGVKRFDLVVVNSSTISRIAGDGRGNPSTHLP